MRLSLAYYPSTEKKQPTTAYYSPLAQDLIKNLLSIPGISEAEKAELLEVKSYAQENAVLNSKQKFPVLLFSPGSGCPVQLYENLITELVSQGYIVVGINTPFNSGSLALKDGRVVKAQFTNQVPEKLLATRIEDLAFSYQKIHEKQAIIPLFSAMDLSRMAAFGHSLGGRATIELAHQHPTWFKAFAAMDPGFFNPGETIKEGKTPALFVISAYWKTYFGKPLNFDLGKQGYLVILSPSEKNQSYSYHMNFADFSTLQTLPAFQAMLAYNKVGNFDLQFRSELPSSEEAKHFAQEVYVFLKTKQGWKLFYYKDGEKLIDLKIKLIAGLEDSLAQLDKKRLGSVTAEEQETLRKELSDAMYKFVGTAEGRELTATIKRYLVDFFDSYLRNNEVKPEFKTCTSLTKDSLIICGPRVF